MAKDPKRRRRRSERPAKEQPPDRDPGTDTSADTKLVNAMESDPGFFKDPLVGQTLGKCKITKGLGEGKTSVVYQAVYKPLQRTVAVKVLQEHMKKVPAVLRVFQQEGRAVAALDHENILKIYDVGEDKGQHYLVLELLKGDDLLKIIEDAEDGCLSVEDALDYTSQAAAGLAAAHRKNLVHRDIKPQNLVVQPDGTLKIVDFGLAAEAEGAFAGGRLGTPHYMSPEQCRGENARTASDIYALGITLFHMLTGRPPYAGRTTTEEIVAEHLKGNRLEPEKLRKGIPPKVADLVRRMTRMDPDARPGAKEVLELVAKLGGGQAAARHRRRSARGAARRVARGKQTGPPPALLGGAAVLVVVVVLFLLMSGGGEDPADETSVVPEKPVVKAPEKPDEPKVVVPKTLEEEIRKLLDEGRREEKTGNYIEAHRLYTDALLKAPANTDLFVEANAAVQAVKELVNREKGKNRERRVVITASQSEAASREFAEKQEEFREALKRLDPKPVIEALTALLENTREGSPERGAIELAIQRAGYVDGLVTVLAERAATLGGAAEAWNRYDFGASSGQTVVDAGPAGITLFDEVENAKKVLPWPSVDAPVLVNLFDALRNAKSARESLWLGYFCTLHGDPRAAQYFDFVLLLEDTAEMRAEVKALQGEG